MLHVTVTQTCVNIYQQSLSCAVIQVTETAYGRCFTFNGPEYIAKNGPRLATFDGRESGLRLFVHIHQDNYFVYDDLTAGVRVSYTVVFVFYLLAENQL